MMPDRYETVVYVDVVDAMVRDILAAIEPHVADMADVRIRE